MSVAKAQLSNSLASWANAITAGRLVLSPLMFWVIPESDRGSWVAFALWFVLCASDGIDGYVARRRGPSASGAFLDPLADKVLVLGAMLTLVGRDHNRDVVRTRDRVIWPTEALAVGAQHHQHVRDRVGGAEALFIEAPRHQG